MDELEQGSRAADDRSQKTGEALRALREGLGAKLETHRRRVSDIEVDLTSRLMQLAEEMAKEQATEAAAQLALRDEELQKLRDTLTERDATLAKLEQQVADAETTRSRLSAELTESRTAIESVRNEECQDCTKLRAELVTAIEQNSEAQQQILELESKVADLTQEVLKSQVAATEFAAQQSQENDLLAQSKFAAEQIQKLLDETLADLEASENREATATLQVDDLRAQIERLTSELATARDAETKLAGATQRELQSSDQVAQLLVQITQLTDDLNRSRESESQAVSQHLATDTAMAELKSAAEKENQILSHQVSSITAERDDLAEQLQQARAENTTHDDVKANELAWLEKECAAAEESRNQLALEFETLLKQHKETEATLAKTLEKQEQYTALLKNAEEKIAELSESTAHEEELEQAQRKFELALADAQKLKRENAELQEELARRPEKSEAESPELVSLRVERDALASRVAELEATPTQIVDPDAERRIEDLQRRFELAVEDVRHLKQENAQLHEKLTKSPHAANHSTSISGAMDWQSQKARLLAALESEDEEVISHDRRAERMSIEETISTTDRVIADKEREIVDLRAQLADQSFAALAPVELANEVIDKDELIAAERAKLEALQKEWHDKLRTAELEMSIQRAALARKESEIEHKLQAALQAAADAPHSPDGKPRRKWLSALGLQADDEKEK